MSAQSLVEFSLLLPVLLVLVVGFFDLAAFMKQDLLATVATAQGANAAALGAPDLVAIDHTVQASQRTLQAAHVAVTGCALRTPGAPATVASDLYLEPISELLRPMWQTSGRLGAPIHHAVTLVTLTGCTGVLGG